MSCGPGTSESMINVAVRFRGVAVPSTVGPSYKVPLPVGNGGSNPYADWDPAAGSTATLNVIGSPLEITGYFDVTLTLGSPVALRLMATLVGAIVMYARSIRPWRLQSPATACVGFSKSPFGPGSEYDGAANVPSPFPMSVAIAFSLSSETTTSVFPSPSTSPARIAAAAPLVVNCSTEFTMYVI